MSRHYAFVGVRVGDEGKGIRTLYYIDRAVRENPSSLEATSVLSRRFMGAANAGHTATIDGQVYKFHQLPVGLLIPGTYNLQGSGVYINPTKEVSEMRKLQEKGIDISPRNLGIASNAFVTFDFHTKEDAPNLAKTEHTTTGNGVKQTARDKYFRVGVRFAEFLDAKECREILEKDKREGRNPALKDLDIGAVVDSYASVREELAPFVVSQTAVWKKHGTKYKISEGANGFDIDIEEGLYPGVTSSHVGNVSMRPDVMVGIMKFYDSSVGHDRPFVGRLSDRNLEKHLRDKWQERGTTTGKDRMIGALDLVAAKHAVETMGIDHLVGTCGDRLEEFAKLGLMIPVITGYKINGKTHTEWDPSFHKRSTLYNAEPIIENLPAWDRFSNNGKIHPNAERFIDMIQDVVGKEFVALGTGPDVKDVLEVRDLLKLDRAI